MISATLRGPGVQQMNSLETGMAMDAIYSRGLVFTAWTPSREELDSLLRGEPVWLIQRGPFIPEMSLKVGSQEDVIPAPLMRDAIKHATGTDPHEEAVRNFKANIKLGRQVITAFVIVAVILVAWMVLR